MGQITRIAWCHHTFNVWEGCTKISPGCKYCYAESRDRRVHGLLADRTPPHWGAGKPRKPMSAGYWKQLVKWNREAMEAGERRRVFCGSLCDWADSEGIPEARARLFGLMKLCTSLDFLLLSKRAGEIPAALPPDWGSGYPNAWLGHSLTTQEEVDTLGPQLLRIPATLHFASLEPLLEEVTIAPLLQQGLGWVIVGGESGSPRNFDPAWARRVIDECHAAGAIPFVKQLGTVAARRLKLVHSKGEDPTEWEAALQVQQFPQSHAV